MLYNRAEEAGPALADCLRDKRHILLVTHVNPDGDAVGSLIGLGLALEARGHTVTMLTPTTTPPFVINIPAIDRVQSFNENPRLPPDADLTILVDTADFKRIAGVWTTRQEYLQDRPMAVIDHHVTNTAQGVVNYIDPGRSSTAELVYELLRAWDFAITPEIATALLLGITTDTQSFRTSNTTPSALRVAADLLELGADHKQLVHDIYNDVPPGTARLLGHSLMALQHDDQIVWTHVSNAMVAASGADHAAYEEVTGYLSTIGGFRAYALFKERADGSVKVSLRSNPPVDVSLVAKQFGGGGHRQAAGCELNESLAHTEELVLQALRVYLGGL